MHKCVCSVASQGLLALREALATELLDKVLRWSFTESQGRNRHSR